MKDRRIAEPLIGSLRGGAPVVWIVTPRLFPLCLQTRRIRGHRSFVFTDEEVVLRSEHMRANRGALRAWTKPSLTGTTPVKAKTRETNWG